MLGFVDFLSHAPALLLAGGNFLGQLVFKLSDVVEIHLDALDGVSHPFHIALMYHDFTDKLVDGGGGDFLKIAVAFHQSDIRPSQRRRE